MNEQHTNDTKPVQPLAEVEPSADTGRGQGIGWMADLPRGHVDLREMDDDERRVQRLADWLQATAERAALAASGAIDDGADIAAARAELAATIADEQDIAKCILAMAGGAGWGDGVHQVKFNGAGMAARAARYITNGGRGRFNGRGSRPSQTSLEDAAAAAVVVIWREWCVWQSLFGEDCPFDPARHYLCGMAWRAAFASLTRDASEGRTGRKAGQPDADGGAAMPLDLAQLDIERQSLESWARDRQGRMFNPGNEDGAKERRARRRVLAWVRDVLDVRAKGRTGGAERARFSVIARLIHGRDIATAARGAGFQSGRAALESFRSGKVWQRLRNAVAAHKGQYERNLSALRRRTAKRAAAAIRAQRRVATGAGAYGVTGYVQHYPASRRPERRTLISNPFAAEWSRRTASRGAAVAEAHAARSLLVSARRERVNLFDNATKGLRAGWLR